MAKRRRFTPQFKAEIVIEALSGQSSQAELCRRRMVRGWQLSRNLTQPLTLQPLQQALTQSVPEIHHSDQGVQYLSTAYISTLEIQFWMDI